MINLLKRYRLSLIAAVAAAAAVLLYWPTLSLPVIYDDLLHIRISHALTVWSVWLPTEDFGFYRPLTFLPMVLIKSLFGYYPSQLLHGLNVAGHALNVILLVGLSWRLWHDHLRAFAAGLLFALFPFSYQAVAVYGHNVHPTTVGLILLGLHTYLYAREAGTRRRIWWGLTSALFLLSLLSHESAILFGAFAAMVHGNQESKIWRPNFRRGWIQPWMVFLLLGILYAVGYQFLPISRGPQAAAESGVDLWMTTLYLLQAGAYPLTWFAHVLPNVSADAIVLGGTAITLALIAWAARTRENRLPLLLGWGWWGVASLLIALPLPTLYLLHGPRLLYLSAVGLALAWPVMLVEKPPASRLSRTYSVLAVGFILISSGAFVSDRLRHYQQLTSPIQAVKMVMSQQPDDQGVVVVNLPQWLAPPRNTYAVGSELVAMLGNYLFAEEIIVENVPGDHHAYSVVVPDLLGSPAYAYGVHDETLFIGDAAAKLPIRSDWNMAGSQLFLVQYPEAGPQTTHAGGFKPADSPDARIASFGPYQLLDVSAMLCDGSANVVTSWTEDPGDLIQPTHSIFVQLLADDGRLIAQADGPLLGLRTDLIELLPNWVIEDRRTLQPTEPGQPAQLLIGVYDFASGDRLPADDIQGMPLAGDAYRLPISDCETNSH